MSDTLKDLVDHIMMFAPQIKLDDREAYNRLFQLTNAAAELLSHRVNVGNKLELLHYPDREHDPYTQLFYQTAVQKFHEAGDFEVGAATMITGSDDAGEYILGYKWIPNAAVVFPQRFDIEMGYTDADGVRCGLVREVVLAYDQRTAEQYLHTHYWDHRLDASDCTCYYEAYPVETELFHVHVERDVHGDDAEFHLQAVTAADVLHGLRILYPDLSQYPSVSIRDDNGNSWYVEDDQLVGNT